MKPKLTCLTRGTGAGEPFIIAMGGKPIVKVTAIDTPERFKRRRIGFLRGEIAVPHDFDEMARLENETMFPAAHETAA